MASLNCLASTFYRQRVNYLLNHFKHMQQYTQINKCNMCTALRHAVYQSHRFVSKRQFSVAIEGNIASGKTSLLQHFKDVKHATVYAEPVSKWKNVRGHNALGYMYEDPNRWALTFQTYVQLTMLETHLIKPETPVKLMERSIFSAKYCFVENLRNWGCLPEIEYVVLSSWFDWIVANNNCNLDLIVYLRTDPETVYQRVQGRGRKEEKAVSLDYLTSLHNLHEEWLIHRRKFQLPCEVLVLDANQDTEGMISQFEEHKSKIMCGFMERDSTEQLSIHEQFQIDDKINAKIV